jgi:hypothetical protein
MPAHAMTAPPARAEALARVEPLVRVPAAQHPLEPVQPGRARGPLVGSAQVGHTVERVGEIGGALPGAPLAAAQVRDERRDEQHARRDEHARDGERDEHGVAHALAGDLHVLHQRGQLVPHGEEDAVLEEQLRGAPVEALAQPVLRGEAGQTLVPGDQAGGDDGEHARGVQLLGRDEGDERHRERHRRGEHRVVEAHAHLHRHEPDDDADGRAHDDGEREVPRDVAERDRARRCRDRGAQQHERGRVVDETLALEHGDEPRRQPELLADRRRGHGVGRGDDRAERDRGRQPEARDERVHEEADEHRGHDHQPHGQRGDRPEVAPEVGHVHVDGSGVQDRRQDDHEHEVGPEGQLRRARKHAQPRADQHEPDRCGDAEPRCEPRDRHHHQDRDHAEGRELDLHRRPSVKPGQVRENLTGPPTSPRPTASARASRRGRSWSPGTSRARRRGSTASLAPPARARRRGS